MPDELKTDRLRLRRWLPADRAPFAELNADPEVMEYFVAPLSRDESGDFVERIDACFEERSYGLWAVEELPTARFVGYVGLWPASFPAAFTPAVEIGWRLARHGWGQGFAAEAARAALADGFTRMKFDEIVSFTAVDNQRSRRVMEKIGMRHVQAEDFDHPSVPMGHKLRRHVLYRISNPG